MQFRLRTLTPTIALLASGAMAQESDRPESITEGMAISQKLGGTIALDASFTTEDGKRIRFGELVGERPLFVFPVYYTCPSGCPKLMENIMRVVGILNPAGRKKPIDLGIGSDLRVGRDFDIVFVGLKSTEKPEIAKERESQIVRNLEDPSIESGLHLLTGDLENIRKLTDSIGFKWIYRPEEDVLNHPTGSAAISREGKIVGYTIGNDLPTIFFKKNLEFADRNEVGPAADQSRMFGCIRVPASSQRYTGFVHTALRVTGAVFVGGMVSLIAFLLRKYPAPLPHGGAAGK
jgi:protein SCO1/2